MKISDALKKAAAACVVRECDEEQPGRFVAYVDEGGGSYDVALETDAQGQPEAGSCDCGLPKPCRHIAALFLFVGNGISVAAPDVTPAAEKPKKRKVKASPAEPLLEQLSRQDLSAWLLDVFALNKDLELAFVSRFSAGRVLTPAEIIRMNEDAVKTVMGRKRIPDATQITKLLQLWKDLHKPVAERYSAAPASREAFDALAAAVDAVMDFANAHPGTAKLQKYARQLFSGFATQIGLLRQDEAFFQAAGFGIAQLAQYRPEKRGPAIDYVRAIGEQVSGNRLAWLAASLGAQYLAHRESSRFDGDIAYRTMVLEILVKADVFGDYADAFSTVAWNPDFNIPLITAWANAGSYELAEKAAWKEIARNTKELHNLPYYDLLKLIYTKSGNDRGLLKLIRRQLPQTFNFDDYLLALRAISDIPQRKEFRNKIYTAARNTKSGAAKIFAFRLKIHEGNWDNVLEMIARDEVGYREVDLYFEQLFHHNSKELLRALMQRRDWEIIYTKDRQAVLELAAKVVRNVMDSYDPETLPSLALQYAASYQYSTAQNLFRPLMLAALKKTGSGD